MYQNKSKIINAVEKLLRDNSVRVPDGWISQCVEFLSNEGIGENNIVNAVYDQWLIGDVSNLQESVLKEALTDGVSFQGSLALQVNYALDISKSKYSQLRLITGANDGNLEVQELEDPAAKWEPKASRCMLLELTDGIQSVKAIELEPLHTLNRPLEPGVKVLVKGPLKYTGGCLLLTQGSLILLGGKVEELVDSFNQQAVLTRLLDTSGVNNGHEACKKTFANPGKIKGAGVKKNSLTQRNQEVKLPASQQIPTESKFKPVNQSMNYQQKVGTTLKQSLNITNTNNKDERRSDSLPIDLDEWDEELDEAAALRASVPTAVIDQPLSDWSDEADDIEVKDTSKKSVGAVTVWDSHVDRMELEAFDDSLLDSSLLDTKPVQAFKPSTPIYKPKTVIRNNDALINQDWSDNDMDFEQESFQQNNPTSNKESATQPSNTKTTKTEALVDLISSSDDDEDNFAYASPQQNTKGGPPIKPFSSKQAASMQIVKGQASLPDRDSCCDQHKSSFTYISMIDRSKPCQATVKGHVSTVLDRISISNDKSGWKLPVRINDGTGYVDCFISTTIIEEHIGSVRETINKSRDDVIERKLILQSMKRFATWLSQVNGMIELDMTDEDITVTSIRIPTHKDIQLFKQCLGDKT